MMIWGVISAAVEALGEIADPRAVPVFSRLIEHSYLEVRLKTVEALAKIRTNEAVKQLKKALDDPNTIVRRSAQKAFETLYNST
ncbi:MAG: HEAT repeat domain-containing protein [Candidatus Bathyarchaeia archaeon]